MTKKNRKTGFEGAQEMVSNNELLAALLLVNPLAAFKHMGVEIPEDESGQFSKPSVEDSRLAEELAKQLGGGSNLYESQLIQAPEDANSLRPPSTEKRYSRPPDITVVISKAILEHSLESYSRRKFIGTKFDFPARDWWAMRATGESMYLYLADGQARIVANLQGELKLNLKVGATNLKTDWITVPLSVEVLPAFILDESNHLYMSVKKGRISILKFPCRPSMGEDLSSLVGDMIPFVPIFSVPERFELADVGLNLQSATDMQLTESSISETGVTLNFHLRTDLEPKKLEQHINTRDIVEPKGGIKLKTAKEDIEKQIESEPQTSFKLGLSNPIVVDSKADNGQEDNTAEVFVGRHDDRRRISPTVKAPERWVCMIYHEHAGQKSLSTGWLAGPRLVMTAAHVVYPTDAVAVVPGCDGRNKAGNVLAPFNWCTAAAVLRPKFYYGQAPPGLTGRQFDYGAIILPENCPFGEALGYFNVVNYPDGELLPDRRGPNTAGYPRDKPIGTMWGTAQALTDLDDYTLSYALDMVDGQSGSPVYFRERDVLNQYPVGLGEDGMRNNVIAIHFGSIGKIVKGVLMSSGVRINGQVMRVIQELNADPDSTPSGMVRQAVNPVMQIKVSNSGLLRKEII